MEEAKERARKRVAVIMQRRTLESRWQNEAWEPVGVVSDYDGEGAARVIVDEGSTTQWLYPGFDIDLRRDEADGYYMNVSTQQPSVFVLWRMEAALAVPQFVTVSYAEAARWMDAGERVDLVPMPQAMYEWVGGYVERNYRPEPKKKMRPQSFRHPKDRAPNT